MNEYLRSIRTDAWTTMGSRYNAARRLRRREAVSTVSIATFSAITIGLVLVQKTYALPAGSSLDNYLTGLSACLGLFILVISLTEACTRNGAKADTLHRNAEELNAFQRKVEGLLFEFRSTEIAPETADQIRLEYEAIKDRCPYNHEPLDYDQFRGQYRKSPEFSSSDGTPAVSVLWKSWTEFRSLFQNLLMFLVFWVVIGFLLVATPWENRSAVPQVAEVNAAFSSQSTDLPGSCDSSDARASNDCPQDALRDAK